MIHLPCLTIKQPWAALIAAGFKTVENRSYAPPKTIRGKRIGIHAGKAFDSKFPDSGPIGTRDGGYAYSRKSIEGGWRMERLENARGAILATAVVGGWVVVKDEETRINVCLAGDGCKFSGLTTPGIPYDEMTDWYATEEDINLGMPNNGLPWWDRSQYGWVLRDIRLLKTPIPAKGKQGIWYADVDKEDLS